MRGSKHNDEIRERAYVLYASGESVSATAKALGLKYSTVNTWVKAWRKADSSKLAESTQTGADATVGEVEKSPAQSDGAGEGDSDLDRIRKDKRRSFIDKSWEIIEGAQAILKRRVERALHKEDLIDELLRLVEENDKLTDEQIKSITAKIQKLRLDDIRALSSILATCYDKAALANGDPTLNLNDVTMKFEDY